MIMTEEDPVVNEETVSIKKGLGWSYAERILAQFISLVVSIVLARILDPEHYGVISIVLIYITILDALVTGGFGAALVQKKDADDLDFNTICWFSIGVSALLYAALFFSSPAIASFYEMEELDLVTKVMGIRVVVSSFNSIQHAYVQKTMQFKRFFWSTLGGTLLSAAVGITLALLGFGVWALVAQYLTNSIADTTVLLFTVRWRPRFRFSFARFRTLFPFGIRILGGTIINVFNDSFRSFVIGKKYSSEDLAYYNQGKKYPVYLMNNMVETIQKVFFPAFSLIQDDRGRIKEVMRKTIRLSSFIILPLLCGIMAVADNFVLCFLTEKWLPCVIYLRIICIVYLTRPLNSIIKSGLLAIGKSRISLLSEACEAIVSIAFVLLAVLIYDSVELIAWSYVGAMVVSLVIMLIFAKKDFGYSLPETGRDYLPFFFTAVLMMVGVYFLGKLPLNSWLVLGLQVVAGLLLYGLLAFLFRFEEIKIVKRLIGKRKAGTPAEEEPPRETPDDPAE